MIIDASLFWKIIKNTKQAIHFICQEWRSKSDTEEVNKFVDHLNKVSKEKLNFRVWRMLERRNIVLLHFWKLLRCFSLDGNFLGAFRNYFLKIINILLYQDLWYDFDLYLKYSRYFFHVKIFEIKKKSIFLRFSTRILP